jgi:hypothetical protein
MKVPATQMGLIGEAPQPTQWPGRDRRERALPPPRIDRRPLVHRWGAKLVELRHADGQAKLTRFFAKLGSGIAAPHAGLLSLSITNRGQQMVQESCASNYFEAANGVIDKYFFKSPQQSRHWFKSDELKSRTSLLSGWSFLNHTAPSGATLSAGLMIRSTMVASASKAAFFSL